MDQELPRVHLRSALLDAGYNDSELRRQIRSGTLLPLRRGAYLAEPLDDRPDKEALRHALLVAFERRRIADDAVVSHISAAVIHGLPVWGVPLARVHVTRARRTGARAGAAVYVHSAPLDPEELTIIADGSVTSPARTVVDLARTCPFESAVVTADAALRRGLVTSVMLDEALRRAGGWPGIPAARRAVAFADGRAESVGESRSRVALWRAGIPAPIPQWNVWHRGEWMARVDFAWPNRRTVAEFDGRIKYGRLLRAGQEPGDVVFEEKLREDALRAAGVKVVRWTWRELTSFTETAARLRAALADQRRPRP